MTVQSDNWPESRYDIMRAIIRHHDGIGGKGPTSSALSNPETRPRALIYLAAEVCRIERRREEERRRLAGRWVIG